MKVSVEWLSEFVSPLPAPEELARRLTRAGLEVEGMHRPAEALAGVVVARVAAAAPHPGAEKLTVTQVEAGGAPLQIVCGAKNFQVGDLVPLATVGTALPGGPTIQRASLRGVESHGMLCSGKELGLSDDASGLLILPKDLVPGTPLAKALGLEDTVLEVNVTPNRGDALSHLGVAREAGAVLRLPLQRKLRVPTESGAPASDAIRIEIADPVGCPRFTARVLEGVKIGPSPAWLRRRLERCGIRSISNIVDVTNYVMLELGQPMHAFDLDRIQGGLLRVRRAREGEPLTTLDGKQRTLVADDLVIEDVRGAQSLAGTMGGADTEVSEKTTRVLLEAANWDPGTIRRMARRHQLHSEASYRFERGVDRSVLPEVLDHAAALMAELSGATVRRGRIDLYPRPAEPRAVPLGKGDVDGLLGAPVPEEEVRSILGSLGFAAEQGNRWRVPGWRQDVERPEDLVEEVARVRGYEHIPSVLPASSGTLTPEPSWVEVERRVRGALSGAGFDEVVNYSFVDPAVLPWVTPRALEKLGTSVGAVTLKNPLTPQQAVMRTSLLASLLSNVAFNVRHQPESLRLYELGRTYLRDPHGGKDLRPVTEERLHVAGVLWGRRDPRGWTAKDATNDFADAKGAVEAILSALSADELTCRLARVAPFHPRATAEARVGEVVLGWIGELHPLVTRQLELPPAIFAFELEFGALEKVARLSPRFRPLPRYPAVLRDLAVVVPATMQAADVRAVILEVGQPLVDDAALFDVYTGAPLPEGQKNLAFALSYRSAERTLRDDEVQEAHRRIVDEVQRRLGGQLRGR
ncbi:MAG TPA: phenylalanine--tRNA ligase subunit beta [Myxococcaceae bacterium]|nr:phenylalanine--tRNA ligase subunit beta [Myxococcaceae bacterium]